MTRNRILKIDKNKFYLTENDYFTLEQTTFPSNSIMFSFRKIIYWEVQIKEYNKNDSSLTFEVLNYDLKEVDSFSTQIIKHKIVKLHFEKLDWKSLEPLLSSYKRIDLEPFIMNFEIYPPNEEDKFIELLYSENRDLDLIGIVEEHIFEGQFNELFTRADFQLGVISILKKVDRISNSVRFEIINEESIPEWNLIKGSFYKFFVGNKRFTLNYKVKYTENNITVLSCNSPELESINKRVIQKLKIEYTKKLLGSTKSGILFTADNIFEGILNRDGFSGNAFKQDEMDILEGLITLENRNKKSIEYIANEKHSITQKIRFTLKPYIGFLFHVENIEQFYFCWELLDSHATYIWCYHKISRNVMIDDLYFFIESQIRQIIQNGRDTYKNNFNQYLGNEKNWSFMTINHDKVALNNELSFKIWKNKFDIIVK